MNSGSLDLASWSSVTFASAICRSTWSGPAEKSVAAAGALSGTALPGSGRAGVAGGLSATSGVTGFSLAADVSGAALVVVAIAFAEASVPAAT